MSCHQEIIAKLAAVIIFISDSHKSFLVYRRRFDTALWHQNWCVQFLRDGV